MARAALFAALLMGSLFILVGCGSKDSKTVITPGGSVTTKEGAEGTITEFKGKDEKGQDVSLKVTEGKDGEVNWKSSDGTSITAGKKVDPADLGIPEYPGWTPTSDAGGIENETAGMKTVVASFTTPDDVKKVGAFYEGKIPGAKKTELTGESSFITFTRTEEGDSLNLIITKDESTSQTTISVTRTFKKK